MRRNLESYLVHILVTHEGAAFIVTSIPNSCEHIVSYWLDRGARVALGYVLPHKNDLRLWDIGTGQEQYTVRRGLYHIGRLRDVPRCGDCGEPGEMAGHMGCQYPQDHQADY